MKGFYLYCIKKKTDSKFSTEGIDGGKIFTIPYQGLPRTFCNKRSRQHPVCQEKVRGLEAVVSKVDLKEFNSKEIDRRAKEDLRWIKEKAIEHEKVIESAMRNGNKIIPVIPMKFGTIFKTKAKLEETLKKHYSQFKTSLENLKGKQEWSVKAYLNRKAFEGDVKKVSPVVQEKEKEIAQLPEGVAYFMQKHVDEAVSREADKALENYTESFFENLKKYTAAGIKGKILEKELTGKSLPMVLNAIFLVSEKNLEDFLKEIEKLNQEYKPKGFNFEYSGPWPPYNFI